MRVKACKISLSALARIDMSWFITNFIAAFLLPPLSLLLLLALGILLLDRRSKFANRCCSPHPACCGSPPRLILPRVRCTCWRRAPPRWTAGIPMGNLKPMRS
jgi:hypothetical protein